MLAAQEEREKVVEQQARSAVPTLLSHVMGERPILVLPGGRPKDLTQRLPEDETRVVSSMAQPTIKVWHKG